MQLDSDLLLLAFRYISHEMEQGERDEFERQLESDALACDAVADAVLLYDATLAVGADAVASHAPEMVTSVSRESTFRSTSEKTSSTNSVVQRGSFIAVALSVTLGLVLSTIALWPGMDDDVVPNQLLSHDHDDMNVAEVWSSLSPVVIEDDNSSMDEDDLGMDDSASISSVPEWMFAVVDAVEVDPPEMMEPVEMSMEQEETL